MIAQLEQIILTFPVSSNLIEKTCGMGADNCHHPINISSSNISVADQHGDVTIRSHLTVVVEF